jgi:DNA polymerase bacteriophage-type
MLKLHHDIETRSPVNLKTAGVYVYAEDPLTEVLMMSWAIDDDPVECWRIWRKEPMPARLREAFLDPETRLCAHNVDFERTLALTSALRNQDYLPSDITKAIVSHDRWSCTAARAAAVGLPRTLAGVCSALGLSVQKDMEGMKIMMKTCKPKALGLDGKWVYHESDALFEREAQYCNRDVESERAVDYSIPELSAFEREVWQTTGRMNDRGIMVDQKLLVQMSLFVADAETDLNKRLRKMTDNMVPRVSDHMALRKWLVAQGFPDIEDEGVGKAVITALLEAKDLPDFIREVLIMRQQGGKSSTAKYKALVQRLNRDSRIRGAIVYCGAASTGRYSSRGAQLQNLPRGGTVKTILQAVEDILNGVPLPLVEMMHGPALIVASEIVRPTFVAPEGQWLARGDYGQIEDRINNWFSGQEEQLDTFRAYDSGTGPDPYRVTAGQIFGIDPGEVTPQQRQGGKVVRLACIAEGQLVTTDHGLVPIERVTLAMKVWDGVEWVSHDGPVFQGVEDCINYDGLIATEDHQVFLEKTGSSISFGAAAARGLSLYRTRVVRSKSWYDRNYERYDYQKTISSQGPSKNSMGQVHNMFIPSLLASLGADKWRAKQWLPKLRAIGIAFLPLVRKTLTGGTGTVYKPKKLCLESLWRTWNHLRFSDCTRRSRMVPNKFAYARETYPRLTAGSYRQRQRVWTDQFETKYAGGAGNQPQSNSVHYAWESIRSFSAWGSCIPAFASRSTLRRHHRESSFILPIGGRNITPLAIRVSGQTSRRVWDILNAGPRHRFTVSGVLVHNCGFSGGKNAILAMARLYQVKLTEDFAEELKVKFREKNPGMQKFWYDLDNAAMQCMREPKGIRHVVRPGLWFTRTERVLAMRLPSGRSLLYWYPKLENVTVPWGERISVTFWAEDAQTKRWTKFKAYGGIFCENLVQATARDLMAYSLVRLDRDGMAPCLTVHDEAICQLSREMFPTPYEAAQAVKIRMLDAPSYLAGLPIAVDASAGPRYVKT